MAPSILIVGATGNTGRGVVNVLPGLINNSPALKGHRLIALTRSKDGAEAQRIAQLPNVEVLEQTWTDIEAKWLREHEVVRIFIAAHNTPPAFAEEGQFLCEALQAGVKYLVRISTTASAVRPDNPAYYPRSHWALETLLEQPEYQSLQWTSLQPALFTTMLLRPVADFVKHYRKTGTMPGPLPILLRADKPHAVVHAPDVGAFAAHLLAAEDTSAHNRKKYVVNGPEDLTGARVRQMAEDAIGEKISDVKFEADRSFIDRRADTEQVHSKRLICGTRDVLDSSRPEMILSTATSETVHQLLGSLTPSKEVLDALLRE